MARRIIRLPEVRERCGLSGEQIRRLENAGKFPKRFKLNPTADPKGNGAAGWFDDEIDNHNERLAARRESASMIGHNNGAPIDPKDNEAVDERNESVAVQRGASVS